ncbi:hypothetical protein M9458_021165, partial [Cirrhinus mrigala]
LPLSVTQPSSAGSKSSSAALVKSKGDLRITVRNAPSGQPPRKSEPSARGPVKLPDKGAGPVSFGAPEEDRMSIAASEEGLTPDEADESAEQPPPAAAALSESEAELAAMLLRAAKSIDLEVPKAPSLEHSRLDDWFLGSRSDVPPRSTPVPFFPEVHEELTKMWRAPSPWMAVRPGGTVRLRNRPRLPSKACKLSSALAAKAYSAAGQAASALHAMAILQVHQAKALKQLHQGGSDPRLMQELRTATDFALRVTKVMSTTVVQERHLWLNLPQMSDADKVRFLDAPISQAGLFGDTFLAVQKQTEAIKHILPRRESTKPLGARPPSARRRGRPPAAAKTPAPPPATTSSEVTPLPRRRAVRKGAAPFGQGTAKNTRKPAKRWRRLLFRGHLHLAGRGDVLPPQVLSRSLSSREPGVKVGAACRNVTLLQNASSSGLPHRGLAAWLSLPSPYRWLIRTVRLGYTIQFKRRPPRFRGVLFTSVRSDTDASVLRAEITVLLAKNAIEPVPPAEMKSGFYSPYFIVPKNSLARSVVRAQGSGAVAPRPSGVSGQPGEEQTLPCAEYLFSWHGVGFDQYVGTPHERAYSVSAELSEPLQTQDSGPPQTFSEAPGAYGSRSRSYATRTAPYETTSALASWPNPEMGMAPWHVPGRRYPGMSPPFQPLVRPCLPTGQHMVVNTDASKTGWGAVCNGQTASGSWSGPRLQWHINCLELLAVLLALHRFLPMLRDKHVLTRTDNVPTVAYINRQGGLRSRRMSQLARHLLLSLRAVHVPGELNRSADALSGQFIRPGEWRLHPHVVQLIW